MYVPKEIKIELREHKLNVIIGREFKQEFNKPTMKEITKIQHLPIGEVKERFVFNAIPWMKRATDEEFKGLFNILRENSQLSQEYMVMLMLATLIASFGLFANSTPVIIGAMILAPLMSPIISLSMGIVR